MKKMIVTMMLLLGVNIDHVAAKEGKDSSEPTRIEIEKRISQILKLKEALIILLLKPFCMQLISK